MAAPSYTEDLTDIDTAESTTGWAESSNGAWDDGGNPTLDPDTFIQNANSVSQSMSKTTICSLIYDNGSGITLPTDGAYLVWQMWTAPTSADTLANGGLRVVIGSSLGDFESFDVGGSDFGRFPYGGWQNQAVNSTVTSDDTVGTPSGTEQFVGSAINTIAAISKGNPHAVDVLRYGRCSSIFEFGEAADYAIFSGYATQNDNNSNRWGLFQAIDGGYLFKGRMQLGTATNAVDFRDSNVSILIDDTRKVTAAFNAIEVNNASSNVDWTNIQIKALGTVSPGTFTHNAGTWDCVSCQFTDVGTFTLLAASVFTGCTFRNTGIITAPGSDLRNSLVTGFEGTANTSPLIWDVATDPITNLTGMTFEMGTNLTHAIEFGTTSPLTMTLTDCVFTGYDTVDDNQNDSTFHVKRTSGTVTINISGSSGTAAADLTYRTDGATVVIAGSVTVTITVKDEAGDPVETAQTAVYDSTGAEVFNSDTNASGVASGSYTGSTPDDALVRVRKTSTGDTRYRNFSTNATITSGGLTLDVTLREDAVV